MGRALFASKAKRQHVAMHVTLACALLTLLGLTSCLVASPTYLSTVRRNNRVDRRRPASYSLLLTGQHAFDAVPLLASLALQDPHAHVYIATDAKRYEWFHEHTKIIFHMLEVHWNMALDKYNLSMSRAEMEAAGVWDGFMLEKIEILEHALSHHNDTLLLDSDVMLLEPIHIPDPRSYLQLGLSPHYMSAIETATRGEFSGGMLWTNQRGLGKAWREATAISRSYENAAIKDLTEFFPYFEFGPEHNVGIWRSDHHEEGPAQFYRELWFDEQAQRVMLKNQTLASIHTHLITPTLSRERQFADFMLYMLGNSTDPTYRRTARVIQWCRGGCLPPQLVI